MSRIDGVQPAFVSKQNITKEQIKKMLPKGSGIAITDEIIDVINRVEDATDITKDYYSEQFLSHIHVLGDISVPIDVYASALKYTILTNNMSNENAYEVVFPEKVLEWQAKQDAGTNKTPLDVYVSRYNSGKIVGKLRTMMALHVNVMYNSYYHFSIKKQYDLACGRDAEGGRVSATVQHLAASKLYDITKPAEEQQAMELKIGYSDSVTAQYEQMNNSLATIVAAQRDALSRGIPIDQVQRIHLPKAEEVIDGELG